MFSWYFFGILFFSKSRSRPKQKTNKNVDPPPYFWFILPALVNTSSYLGSSLSFVSNTGYKTGDRERDPVDVPVVKTFCPHEPAQNTGI